MPGEYEPQIIELEPEKAPRTSAIILLICGLLGVAFLMVNVVFTGEDPYHSGWWPDDDDPTIQEQSNILPNVWRGHGEDDEEEEVEEQVESRKGARPTTGPFALPGFTPYMQRPTLPGVPNPQAPTGRPGTPTGATPPGRTTPGAQPSGAARPTPGTGTPAK